MDVANCVLIGAVAIGLYFYHKKHPWNYVLLTLFTILLAVTVGFTCSFKAGIKLFICVSVNCIRNILCSWNINEFGT